MPLRRDGGLRGLVARGDEEDVARALAARGVRSRTEEAFLVAFVELNTDLDEILEAIEKRRVYLAHYAPGLGDVRGEKLSRVARYHKLTSDLIRRENEGGK